MRINKTLFLTLTASLSAGAAFAVSSCASSGNGTTPTVDGSSDSSSPDGSGEDATGEDAAEDTTQSSDAIADTGNADSTTTSDTGTSDTGTSDTGTVADTGTPDTGAVADTGAADTGTDSASSDAGTEDASDSSVDSGLDAAQDSGSDASDGATDAAFASLPDGGAAAGCPAFTCELASAACHAAYSGSLINSAAVAVYNCLPAACALDAGYLSEDYIESCVASALETTTPSPDVTDFCAQQASCPDGGSSLTVSQCEAVFSALTPEAFAGFQTTWLHDGGLQCASAASASYAIVLYLGGV